MSSQPSSSSDPLTPQLLAAVRAQLAAGDRLAWAACPEPAAFEPPAQVRARARRRWDALGIVGGGYLTLGAAVMALRSGRWSWLFVPITALLIGVLVYFMAKRNRDRAQRAVTGTVYALTTQRALIVRTYPVLEVQALAMDAIADVKVINKHPRADLADLGLAAAETSQALVFRGIPEPERARSQLLRVIRDPRSTDQELAATEAYAAAMRQLMVRQ